MANANDRAVIEDMMKLPEQLMAEYFSRNAHRILDDAVYWNVLGTLWKLGGTVVQQDLWLSMFNANRKQRHKIMKKRERRAWRRLPKQIKAYRAVNHNDEANTAISWTLSRDTAERVFSENGKRAIVSKIFCKDKVFAYFDRRKESEILVRL